MTQSQLDRLYRQPLLLADALHQQADKVMETLRVTEIIQPYGLVVRTGSYFLNVMVYPDIDLYLPELTIGQIFDIAAQFAQDEKVVQEVFEQGDATMPGGLYLKLRIAMGDWGRPWKLDLWSLDSELLEKKMVPMRRFAQRLTSQSREMIIRYKVSIMTPDHRTPMYSGYFIYKAFLDEGITDFDQVTQYLKNNGIRLD